MANVIAFKRRRKGALQRPDQPCQVLFFTGVRYHRHEDESKAKPSKPPRAPRKRQA